MTLDQHKSGDINQMITLTSSFFTVIGPAKSDYNVHFPRNGLSSSGQPSRRERVGLAQNDPAHCPRTWRRRISQLYRQRIR